MNKRRKDGCDFDGCHVVEVASEDEVGQQYFMVGVDLASNSALKSDNSSVHQSVSLNHSAVGAHFGPQHQARFLFYLAG
jgi:hypothetical protein